MLKSMVRLFKDEEGQGLVEYALILVLIALVAIITMTTLGGSVRDKFTEANDALTKTAS